MWLFTVASLTTSRAAISAHDWSVLAAWLAVGLVTSLLFFRWDPSRPRHAR